MSTNFEIRRAHKGDIKRVKENGSWGAAELDTIVHPNTYVSVSES